MICLATEVLSFKLQIYENIAYYFIPIYTSYNDIQYKVNETAVARGSMLDCRLTGQAIDPAPGVWFIPKLI